MLASGASQLVFGGNWNNTGRITISGASTLTLGGSFKTSNIGSLTAAGGNTVNLTGVLDNSSATLTPSSYGAATWTLISGGTISNGTLNVSGGNFAVGNGTFKGVSVTG